MPKSKISYDRAPSGDLLKLLKPEGLLSPLARKDLEVKQQHTRVDVHFRPGDWIHVYCGLTRVIDLQRLRGGKLMLTAHHTYKKQGCGGFLREWRDDDPSLTSELRNYLDCVVVNDRHVKGEGSVQFEWSRVTDPWIPFDREVRLENREDSPCDRVNDAYKELGEIHREHSRKKGRDRWLKPKKTAVKLDQLAIDPDGRLVLLELKSGKTTEYFAPFQLLQYVCEWHSALQSSPKLLEQVNSLIKAREEVGLTPRLNAPLTPQIRAAVCLGRDKRSAEVKRRYGIVLDIVNNHRPPGVPCFETWEYDNGPHRLS